jgi:hypothetical protein
MINEEEPQQHHHEITREGCRRNTIGTPEELSSSSGNDEFENELYRSRSWYGGFIVDSLKNMPENILKIKKKEEPSLLKRALKQITQLCPRECLDELQTHYIQPVKHKMKQASIVIGICGQSESGKKTLFEVLQHSRLAYRCCKYHHPWECLETLIYAATMDVSYLKSFDKMILVV